MVSGSGDLAVPCGPGYFLVMKDEIGLEGAIRSLAAGDLAGARRHARRVAGEGELEALALDWLEGLDPDKDPSGAYADPGGFPAYGRGRSAEALLRSRVQWLVDLWSELPAARVLDLGSGDGRVLAEALDRLPPGTRPNLDLVEPSGPLLGLARSTIPPGCVHAFHPASAEAFVDGLRGNRRWALGQGFLSLQSVPRGRRNQLLSSLAPRVERFALIEFDVNFGGLSHRSSERCRAVCERYRTGIREYGGEMDPETAHRARHGFLMPMLFGSFRDDGPRSNDEQPIADWIRLFEGAGFALEHREVLCEHWWSRPVALLFRSRR